MTSKDKDFEIRVEDHSGETDEFRDALRAVARWMQREAETKGKTPGPQIGGKRIDGVALVVTARGTNMIMTYNFDGKDAAHLHECLTEMMANTEFAAFEKVRMDEVVRGMVSEILNEIKSECLEEGKVPPDPEAIKERISKALADKGVHVDIMVGEGEPPPEFLKKAGGKIIEVLDLNEKTTKH